MRKSEPNSESGNPSGPSAGEGHNPVSGRAVVINVHTIKRQRSSELYSQDGGATLLPAKSIRIDRKAFLIGVCGFGLPPQTPAKNLQVHAGLWLHWSLPLHRRIIT